MRFPLAAFVATAIVLAAGTQAIGIEPASRTFSGVLTGKLTQGLPIGKPKSAKLSHAGTLLNLFTAPPGWRFLTVDYANGRAIGVAAATRAASS